MSMWVALEAAACFVCFLCRRKMGFLAYEISVAGVYLLALAMVQELDYTMSVYFAFAVFPYLGRFRVPSRAALLCLVYFAVVSINSLLSNDPVKVASILIIHYLGPLILLYVFSNVEPGEFFPRGAADAATGCRNALILAATFEAAIGALAMSLSSDGRLMLNYQCVSGCISCISILLALYLIRSNRYVLFAECLAAYFFAWSFASGTRGYIVIATVLVVFVLVSLRDARAKLMLVLAAALVVAGVAAFSPETMQDVISGSRFGESVGRRTYENRWFTNFFPSLDTVNQLFGIGIGSVYGEWPGAQAAMVGVGADDWSIAKIMESTALHNFWYTTVLVSGLCGIIAYVAPFVVYVKGLRGRLGRGAFAVVLAFMAAYAFVLWYRWTATGGVLESAILATFVALGCRAEGVEQRSLSVACAPLRGEGRR